MGHPLHSGKRFIAKLLSKGRTSEVSHRVTGAKKVWSVGTNPQRFYKATPIKCWVNAYDKNHNPADWREEMNLWILKKYL